MKQAFLITAYNHFDHLEKLIKFLDDEDVWFYVYIDAKVSVPRSLVSLNTANPIEVLHTQRVEWGHRSQIISEIELFDKAYANTSIEWFHLLSGTDFPLRTADAILKFYENAVDVDCFMEIKPLPDCHAHRVEIYHLGSGRRPLETGCLKSRLQAKLSALQVKAGIKRKSPVAGGFMFGSNWVDLRRNAVAMLLADRDSIIRMTKHTLIANEIYKQTFLNNRKLRIVNNNLRYIDWSEQQPSPKSLGPEDFDQMMQSGKLFARKFDRVDSDLLRDKIVDELRPAYRVE